MAPRRLGAALALLLAVGGCAHGEAGGAPPAPNDAARLYRRSCTSCHRLKAPREHDAETWRRAVERFGTRLTPEERRAIADYLAANARPAR